METSDLMLLLEALFGPVVADITAPIPHLIDIPTLTPAGADAGGLASLNQRPGTITALLSSRPPIGLAILDAASLRVIQANAALAVILGHPGREHEAAGNPLSDLAPTLGGSEVETAFAQVTRTGQPFAALVLEERAGGPTYLRCALSPLRHSDGTFDQLLLTLIDVTQEVEARRLISERVHAVARAEDEATRATIRTAVTDLLARAATLDDALRQITERIAQSFGDCCAVFLLDKEDQLSLAALAHLDASQGFRLRAAYGEEPPHRDTDLVGQVVATGNSFLAAEWGPQYAALVAPGLRDDLDAAHIAALACAPLRAEGRIHGALLLFSTSAASGGSGRSLGSGDLIFLQEVADLVAQTVWALQLHAELAAMRAERTTLLDTSPDGIAIYDSLGRLRQLNTAGRQLLSRPLIAANDDAAVPGAAAFRRTFLAADGQPLTAEELPWARALRGERIGVDNPLPIVIEWAGGARRTLLMRAWPVLQDSATPTGAIVTMHDDAPIAPGAPPAVSPAMSESETANLSSDSEWARWREAMELLDEAVVLCAPTGEALYFNPAARMLLDLPETGSSSEASLLSDRPLWESVCQPDGSPLPAGQTPVARAMAGQTVRAQPTAIALPNATLRPIYWDARRIDLASGASIGVALVAWPAADEETPDQQDPQDTQPVEPQAAGAPAAADAQFEKTTLLPGRHVALEDHSPPAARLAGPPAVQSDLAEICAREARAHPGTQGRRLEIRLPRRRVLVPVAESQVERAVNALITVAADVLPRQVPLHIAVWIERSVTDPATLSPVPHSPLPPGMDIGDLNTLLLKDGKLPELLPATRPAAAGPSAPAQASVAVVRVCSPNARVAAIQVEQFAACRTLVDQMGGRAWARVDPVLGPTYSFSLPVSESPEA